MSSAATLTPLHGSPVPVLRSARRSGNQALKQALHSVEAEPGPVGLKARQVLQ
jgi:hypothetical protein